MTAADYGALLRWRLSLANGAVAAGAALCAAPSNVLAAFLAALGVTLLAGAASAINQVLERDLDARMSRTSLRPVACGTLSPVAAFLLSIPMGITGALLLAVTGSGPLALGLAALLWYLFVYTPLKRRTAWAFVPGALSGALPPLIGWCSAGAPLTALPLGLAVLLYLWQLPHAARLALRFDADLRAAGLPSLHERLTSRRLSPLTPAP